MDVLVKSSNGITQVTADSQLLSMRKVLITGEITPASACDFTKKILLLNYESTNRPIDVLINSPGGEILSGLLMYDIIQTSKAPMRMICIGQAYSMAAVLIASGNHGRYILPHGELMLHEPLLGDRVGGSSSSIKSISESLLETKHKMNAILAKHTGKSESEIEQVTSFDHFFNPQESVAFGLCDKIVGFDMLLSDE